MKSLKHLGPNTLSSTLLIALLTMLISCKNLPLIGSTTSADNNAQSSTNNTDVLDNAKGKQYHVDTAPLAAPNRHQATPLEAVSFWEDLSANFALDLSSTNARTVAQRNWYASHPEYIRRVIKRAEPYIYYIYQQAKHRNIPAELVLLPIVESAFDPFAYSHGRASGIWQFIPGTGKAYGLKQTWWYDGRRDIKASTDAAFNYLTKLNSQFDGDWLLALAAYNSGGGTVRKAVRYNKKRGRPTDFWSLKLPKETQAYVPKLIAISQIFNTPEKYGITLPTIPNTQQVAVAYTGSQIDMAQAATLAELTIDELYTLNPGFNRWATDPNGPHSLLLPIKKAEAFTVRLSKLPKEERVTWSRYKIKSGDSLISIARANKTTPSMIRDVNHIKGNKIIAGKTILIPSATQSSKAYRLALDQRMKAKTSRAVKGKRRVHHYVQSGDSFWKISKQYKVNTRSLAKWNGMAPTDPLVTGKKLTVWVTNKSSTGRKSGRIRKVNYKARNGDSYARIADKFNVSINEIKRWNKVDLKRYLQPGQLLTLYVDITNAP
ncbi:lytic transglycosylase [Gammaproteobacteria bacterium 42_54_T18]|nr:lytic transglycosylase [Gammaproteobacteria bacterium 42_54_T18]